METLTQHLTKKGYTKVKLKLTNTNHFEVKAKINGIKGCFILDTGASNSCVDFSATDKFKLNAKTSTIKAVGAGASNLSTKISKKNKVKIGAWKNKHITLVLFNLSHVNQGLLEHNANPVDGIIGADILKQGKAIINYKKSTVYLKL